MSTAIEEMKEKYEIGQAIFEKLFSLSDIEIKEKLIDITDNEYNDILKNNCDIIRTIRNNIPEKIELWFYDMIKINWVGISYKPEHGLEKNIVKFNKYFTL